LTAANNTRASHDPPNRPGRRTGGLGSGPAITPTTISGAIDEPPSLWPRRRRERRQQQQREATAAAAARGRVPERGVAGRGANGGDVVAGAGTGAGRGAGGGRGEICTLSSDRSICMYAYYIYIYICMIYEALAPFVCLPVRPSIRPSRCHPPFLTTPPMRPPPPTKHTHTHTHTTPVD
jgi:hypothetical protein